MEIKEASILDRIKFAQKYFNTGIRSYDDQLPGPKDIVLRKIGFVN